MLCTNKSHTVVFSLCNLMITLKVFTFVCLDIWYFLTAHISVWCISPTLENAFSFITPSLSSKTVTFSLSFFGFLHMAFIWTIKNHQQRPESPKQETGNGNVSDLVLEGLKTNGTNFISWISIKVHLLNINQSLSLEYKSSLAESRLSGSCPVKAAPQALSALSRTCQLGWGTLQELSQVPQPTCFSSPAKTLSSIQSCM